MATQEPLEFIAKYGVVLESAKGPIPNLADTVAGEALEESYWGHPKGDEIFLLTRAIRSSEEVLVCRLVNGKVTYIHRTLWASIYRLQESFNNEHLGAIREIHSSSGKHVVETIPFPKWVPDDVRKDAEKLTHSRAVSNLGQWSEAYLKDRPDRGAS